MYLLAALCVTGMSCSPAPDSRIDEADIRAASREWNQSETAKDLEKCLSFYATDAERFVTGSPPIEGPAALRKEWTKNLAMPGTFNWYTSKVEVSRSGDLGYETGRLEIISEDNNQQPTTTEGKYLLVWKKQADGKWKVVADIDNSDR